MELVGWRSDAASCGGVTKHVLQQIRRSAFGKQNRDTQSSCVLTWPSYLLIKTCWLPKLPKSGECSETIDAIVSCIWHFHTQRFMCCRCLRSVVSVRAPAYCACTAERLETVLGDAKFQAAKMERVGGSVASSTSQQGRLETRSTSPR